MSITIASIIKTVTYTDTTAIKIGGLPPKAVIKDIDVIVGTAFDAGGTDYISVGTLTDDDKFANDVDVSSTGKATVTPLNVGAVESNTLSTDIYAIYVPGGTTPTAGTAEVIVTYVQK